MVCKNSADCHSAVDASIHNHVNQDRNLNRRDIFKQNRAVALADQRRVAAVLSAYDDLIENNTRRIAILEEMAQRLYDEWFVRFRFPGHEDVRMVECELGSIPEIWQISTVSSFGSVLTGKTPSKKRPDYYGDDIPFLKLPDMHNQVFALSTAERLSRAGATSQISKTAPPDTLCVSCIGTAGFINITTEATQTNQLCGTA